jgi:hypothetical protein
VKRTRPNYYVVFCWRVLKKTNPLLTVDYKSSSLTVDYTSSSLTVDYKSSSSTVDWWPPHDAVNRSGAYDNHGVASLVLVGKHPEKMALVDQFAEGVVLNSPEYAALLARGNFDVVVDATGSPRGLEDAV